jgi:predicted ABC-type transport system involved in lysophospholipase L1 biosynthesis ATPase subunit
LCDEPTGNLDERTAGEVADLIWSEGVRDGAAVVIVTHNQALAKRARSIYHLSGGHFAEQGREAVH